MRASEVRKLSAEELAARELELRTAVASLLMKRNARRLEKPSQLRQAKLDLAQLLTIRSEKTRLESQGSGE